MGIIDTFRSFFSRPQPAPPQPNILLLQGSGTPERKGVLTEWYYRAPYGQPRGVNLTEIRELARSPWVSMCINTIVNEVTSIDFRVVPKKETSTAERHAEEVNEFLAAPNANDESFKQILRAVSRDVLEVDAGVIEKVFNKKGDMVELYARDGASFLVDVDQNGMVTGYYQYSYAQPGLYRKFDVKEIVYIVEHPRSYSPYGYSHVQALADIIKTLIYSISWNLTFFKENAIPSGILSILDISETEREYFEEYWNTKLKGKPHKLPILNKEVKWQPFTFTPEDLRFLESQEWYLKLVMATFGVTPNEMGFTETVNKATSESQSKIFRRKAIRPLIDLLEYHINLEIIPEFGYSDIQFKFIPATDLDEEIAKRRVWETDIKYGIRTPNEIRAELGLDPVPWGDAPLQPQQPFAAPAAAEEETKNLEQAVKQADLILQALPENYASLDPIKQQELVAPVLEALREIENAIVAGKPLNGVRDLLYKKAEEVNLNVKPKKSAKMLKIEEKYGEPVEKLLARWRAEGKSTTEIAQLCGITHVSILNWLEKFGVE